MVVGESGLGKSTLVNSLFLSDLYSNRKIPPVDSRAERTTEIEKTTMEIEEKGVKVSCILYIDRELLRYSNQAHQFMYIYPFETIQLRLTVVDTPGFGDGLEGNGSWKACVKYVDDQFAAYFDGESG